MHNSKQIYIDLFLMPLFHQRIKSRPRRRPLIMESQRKKKQKWAGILDRY